jgi:hypothetical protein
VASTVEAVVTLADLRLADRAFPSRFGGERAFNAGEEDELAKEGQLVFSLPGVAESRRLRRSVSTIAATHAYWQLYEDR